MWSCPAFASIRSTCRFPLCGVNDSRKNRSPAAQTTHELLACFYMEELKDEPAYR